MTDEAVRTCRLTKHYGATGAVRDLDLTVQRGEILGLIGPNGSGKSTTMKMLLNLVHPTSGSASVFGLDVVRDSLEVRRRTGFVTDENHLYRSMRGRFLLRLAAALHGERVDGGRGNRLARELEVPLERRVKTYSAGMKQKLALVVALAHDPDLLVLDEPTNGLDPTSRAQILDLIGAEHRRGKTVLLSSHVLSEIEKLCDRIVFLRKGSLVSESEVTSVRERLGRYVRVSFGADVPDEALLARGARSVTRLSRHVLVEVDGDPRPVVARLCELPVTRLDYRAPDLEEVYRALYADEMLHERLP